MIIKNTTTGTAWKLPSDVKLPKGQYVDMSFVLTLHDELKADIEADIKNNDAKPHMNEALGMRHTFIVEKQSVYTKDAREIPLQSRYKDAKRKAKRKGE
ncbi:hypothetical protein FCV60_19350 [Vibrio sp. F13]|uniref:hypothetical protein n=1 Tax=unclassified Vibrio TaxID=2614977 RepID=UPI0010BDC3AB|nr:hypothetical protein [Vibrio sp. F13]TKF42935.1 hypothetical protein FCV49_15195 [Vibrio sp. F13]TKF50837.1 hypothetical protein FCV60_19350 [Vibrio sp. F13]TKG06276.1 hypothetical protein FCV67_15360 [Vibrio sp. F13]